MSERVAVVTGAGQGIGRAVARAYAAAGARVAIADKDGGTAVETLRLIEDAGGSGFVQDTDVADPKQITDLMDAVVHRWGRIDVLINNAGVMVWKSPFDLAVEEWDEVLNINLRGMFFCAREAAKVMKERDGGAIVNIASTRALMSEPDTEAYAASKGGIVALTHALAVSFGPYRIRVNAISPGWIETGNYGALKETDHTQHPSGRVGTPDDIARACLFLTDVHNDFVTGTNLVVDGGMTRKMMYEP